MKLKLFGKDVSEIRIGNDVPSAIMLGSVKVWPTREVVTTYRLDLYVEYSLGTYLLPSSSNEAKVKGVVVAMQDGEDVYSEDVGYLTPSTPTNDVVLRSGQKLYYNKTSYGTTIVTAGFVTVSASFGGMTSSVDVTYGENIIESHETAIISFKVGSYTSSFTTTKSAKSLVGSASKSTLYTYTSGENRTETLTTGITYGSSASFVTVASGSSTFSIARNSTGKARTATLYCYAQDNPSSRKEITMTQSK